MIALYFLMGALAVVAALLLFGFVGCDVVFGLDDRTPYGEDYPKVIRETEGLLAYWRLGEPNTTPVPSMAGAARSEVGGFHGDYFILNPVLMPDNQRHAPATAGTITLGMTPGLLERETQEVYPCLAVDGGYVQVPFAVQLNPPQFTLEAWVFPDPSLDPHYFYCLAESTGPPGNQGLGRRRAGWGLYLGPSDPNNPTGPPLWQVWMGDGGDSGDNFKRVAIARPDFPKISDGTVISPLALTYLVLTFDGMQRLQLFLYIPSNGNNTGQDLTLDNLQALATPIPPFTFQPNDNSPGGKGDFFIGAGSRLSFGGGSQRLYPFRGKIQEVALYDRDLSGPTYAGMHSVLLSHLTSGGNL